MIGYRQQPKQHPPAYAAAASSRSYRQPHQTDSGTRSTAVPPSSYYSPSSSYRTTNSSPFNGSRAPCRAAEVRTNCPWTVTLRPWRESQIIGRHHPTAVAPVAPQCAPPCAISSRTTSSSRRVPFSSRPRSHRQRRTSSQTTQTTSCGADSSAPESSRWDSLGTTQQLQCIPNPPISSSRSWLQFQRSRQLRRLFRPLQTLISFSWTASAHRSCRWYMRLSMAKSTRRKMRAITEDFTALIMPMHPLLAHHTQWLALTSPDEWNRYYVNKTKQTSSFYFLFRL